MVCKNRSAIVLMTACVLLFPSLALSSASSLDGWRTVGSAGTIDEDSTDIVALKGPFVEVKTTRIIGFLRLFCSSAKGTVTVRYNIEPVGSLFATPPDMSAGYYISGRFRATGA